ncbi:MAG TPA: serine/threonine-protein kinase [Thermoanaerobaculia bacterium]|nr:serine/threonine-protein kinase [Thermoanaerobaculia bacterium]
MKADSPELFRRARAPFEEIVELAGPERAARLAELTRDDPELAAAVGRLLAADESAGGFLEEPAAAYVPSVLEEVEGLAAGEPRVGEEIGPYRTVALLGRGGMGEVYLAERADGQFEQRVALKLLRRGMDSEESLRRFLRERQVLARLEHPHIARLLDGGRAADGRPFIVIERVEGEPITRWCAARGSSMEERLRLVITCCEAVEVAHRNLVVHRDLKPSNVLVNAEGQVKLLDFGIAKLLAEDEEVTQLTRADAAALTPAYAAPEQILGGAVTTATDVYALGVMLYELLTGALPHDRRAGSTAELALKVSRETLVPPSAAVRRALVPTAEPRLARRLQGDLDTILLKALHRDPLRRYASAAALGEDLRRHLAGRPVKARPDTLGYRVAKLIERHRMGVAAAVLIALSLLGGLAAALWQWRRAEAAVVRAEANARQAERVKGFVISLFREADPLRRNQARERDATAGELLQAAVDRLDRELEAEPEVRAQLLLDFAFVYGNRGDLDRALSLAERSLALYRAATGEGSPEVAESLSAISDMLTSKRDFPAAEAAGREALAIQERVFGVDSLEAAQAASRLLVIEIHRENPEEGLLLCRRVLETYTRELGPDDPATALQTMNLGVVQVSLGRYAEAEETLEDAVSRLSAAHGPGHTKVGFALQNLAEAVLRQGRPREAAALLERAAAILDAQLGPEHSMAAAVREELAQVRAPRPRP